MGASPTRRNGTPKPAEVVVRDGSFAAKLSVVAGTGSARSVELFARRGRLLLDGKRVAFTFAYLMKRDREDAEPNAVRVVDGRLRAAAEVSLPTTAEARRLLASLGTGAPRSSLTFRPDALRTPLFTLFWLALVAALGSGILAVLTPWLAPIPFVILAGVESLGRRREISLNERGIRVEGVLHDQWLPWDEVARVERLFDDGLRFGLRPVLRDDAHLSLAELDADARAFDRYRDRDPVDVRRLEPGQWECLYAATLRFRVADDDAARGEESDGEAGHPGSMRELVSALAIGGRKPELWLDAVSALVPREGYRKAAVDDEALESLARDVDEDASARVAAVLLLRRRGVAAPRIHLDDRTDGALRFQMDQAMTALAEDPTATRPVLAFAKLWTATALRKRRP